MDTDNIQSQCCENLTTDSTKTFHLSQIYKLATEQLITVKAKVLIISSVKTFVSINANLKKQEAIISDPTASMKLVLWGDYVDCLECDQTYKFETVPVKGPKDDRYLNTPKSDKFTEIPCDPFEQPINETEDLEYLASTSITVKLTGIKSIDKTYACFTCNRKVSVHNNGVLATCDSDKCHLTQALKLCKPQWFVRLLVLDNATDKLLTVTINQSMTPQFEQLLLKIHKDFQSAKATVDEVKDLLFVHLDQDIKLTFDNTDHVVSEIQL